MSRRYLESYFKEDTALAFDKNNPKNHKRRKVCQFCVDKATFIDS